MEHVIDFLFIVWIPTYAATLPKTGKEEELSCNVSLEETYKKRGYYSLKITWKKSEKIPNNKTFLQLCFKPNSDGSEAVGSIFSNVNKCKGKKDGFYGIGHAVDITTGKLDDAYIKAMTEWDHTNLEIKRAVDTDYTGENTNKKRTIDIMFWNSPENPGKYKCVIFHITPKSRRHHILVVAESEHSAVLNKTSGNVMLSIRHVQRGFILGDYVYIVCDYRQGQDNTAEVIDVEYADNISVDNLMYAEVTPQQFELNYKRKAAVFQISVPIKGTNWYFLNPTMTVKCFSKNAEGTSEQTEKIKISFVPFDPIIYLRKRRGNLKIADIFSGVQIFKPGDNINEQQLADRLKRNSLRVGDKLSCHFKGDPKPTVEWKVPKKLSRYVKSEETKPKVITIEDDNPSRSHDKLLKFYINCSAWNVINNNTRNESITLQFYVRFEGMKKDKDISYKGVAFIALNILAISSFYVWIGIVRDLRETRFVSPRVSKVPSYMISKSTEASRKTMSTHSRGASLNKTNEDTIPENIRILDSRRQSDDFFL